MLRGQVLAGIAITMAVCVLSPVASSTPPPFTQRGTVTAVVDPVTLDMHLTDGTSERVRLIGLQPPAGGSCALTQATSDLSGLVSGKPVWLLVVPPNGKGKHAVVSAYAILPGGADVGLELVERGDATVEHGEGPFKQLAAYTRAQKAAQAGKVGLWGCSPAPAPTPPAPAPPGHENGHGQDNGNGKNGKG
jgi:endonuclease YncB( thermonuclease family)